jgi:salicylate hydroxylase
MPTKVPLLVVGGGIGGLATALSAARRGLRVHVLEQAAEFGEIGAGLQLGPNACRALAELGVLDDVLPRAVLPRAAVLRDAIGGRLLTRLDLSDGFRDRFGYPYLVMHRGDLLDVLLSHCRATDLITLEAGRTVVHSSVRVDGADVACADGTRYSGDVLVAADGLRSRQRGHISADKPVCSGYAAYRGTVPRVPGPDSVTLWIGPGLHFVQYPVRAGSLTNQVAVFRSPRFHAGEASWGGVDELDAAFAGACEPVRAALAGVGRDRFWAMYDRAPIDSWVTGRLALLGDAAHPMLQYLGQGACQALEDAVELGRQLGRHGFDGGLREYERIRLPRASRCQVAARPWGELWHTADPLTIAVRDRMFALRADDDYSELDWLYGETSPRPI